MRKIRLVIFDLDGTLVDAYPAITSSFNFTMQKFGYPRKDALTIRRAVGWGDRNLLKPFVKKSDLDLALATYRRHHRVSLIKYSRLFPGVKSLLARLKAKGYRLAVASNRPTNFSLILIRHLKLGAFFDYVLCADKLKHGKPYPDILRKIMRRFKLNPSQAAYVGDMAIDAQAGRRAGVRTFMLTTGSSSPGEIRRERPFKMVRRVGDILKLIQ